MWEPSCVCQITSLTISLQAKCYLTLLIISSVWYSSFLDVILRTQHTNATITRVHNAQSLNNSQKFLDRFRGDLDQQLLPFPHFQMLNSEITITYLGLSLFTGRLNKPQWKSFIEKVQKRLAGWKVKECSLLEEGSQWLTRSSLPSQHISSLSSRF